MEIAKWSGYKGCGALGQHRIFFNLSGDNPDQSLDHILHIWSEFIIF